MRCYRRCRAGLCRFLPPGPAPIVAGPAAPGPIVDSSASPLCAVVPVTIVGPTVPERVGISDVETKQASLPSATPLEQLPAWRGLLTRCQCLKMKAVSRAEDDDGCLTLEILLHIAYEVSPTCTGRRNSVRCHPMNMTSLIFLKIRSCPCSWWSRRKTPLPPVAHVPHTLF
jgi:hypothetical protein